MAGAEKEAGYCIVGIGTSAGGLVALQHFFDHMPATSGMAFVVIQHLSADFKSQMEDLLGRRTVMKIQYAADGLELEPDNIYLNVSRTQMTVSNGRFSVTEVAADEHVNLPIDFFFRSLAEDAKEKAIGIILSGTGRDGSAGIRAIHDAGGLVVIQEPETAQFDTMPRSAIATGIADFVLPPDDIPAILMEHLAYPFAVPSELRGRLEDREGDLATVFNLLQHGYNLDFGKYKLATVGRRIQRRMDFRQIAKARDYIELLRYDLDELDELYHDLLIGVTEFFRDDEAFAYLESIVLPEAFANLQPGEDMRVWSAGCATGEEAYSLAILLLEKAEELKFAGKIVVFATNVHKRSLELATHGTFTRERLAKVNPERLERFFSEIAPDVFKVKPELRRLVTFAHHDVTLDTPFSRLSLVCCRNLLIYLQPETQKKVISLFHFALKVNGFLFLGSSEGLGTYTGEFELVSGPYKIFRKIRDLKLTIELDFTRKGQLFAAPRYVQPPLPKSISLDRQLLNDYDVLLDRHMPPGVLVDEKFKILHAFGNLTQWLKTPKGRFENDLLTLIDDSLRIAVSTSLHKAKKTGHGATARNVRIEKGDGAEFLDVTVEPVPFDTSPSLHYHVYFQHLRQIQEGADAQGEEVGRHDEAPPSLLYHQHLADLELELQSSREDLLTSRESLQTTIEELNATNEELQSTNEELQSTNEELNSANEELQSANEELYSVNAEFERNNNELKQLNSDMVNLLGSIDSAILFLDKEMRIRRFNPASSAFFKLLPQDIGRPIDHISYQLADQAGILADIQSVLKDSVPVEKEVSTKDGEWLIVRILPFAAEGRSEGAVVTFINVTKLKESQQIVFDLNVELEKRLAELESANQQIQRETEERLQAAEELRQKDQMMIQQSRMAAMGEMLGNIAHQWRQPLNVLGLKVQELGYSFQKGALSQETLNDSIDGMMGLVQHMSQTIDDFRNFLITDKEKRLFRVEETVRKVVSLMEDNFRAEGVTVDIGVTGDPQINGYANEYGQVLLNILTNAKDVLLERGIKEPRIEIRSWEENGKSVLTVTDNAGGVPEEILNRIFDPYFTTKDQGKGTGVGLFMSNAIIEKNMGGRLSCRNVEGGAEFRIEV